MFKKDPQPKASANIKSSERRKLLSGICNSYGIPQNDLNKEAELNILPSTTKQASYQSVQGHKGTIYFDENETPTWFKTRDSQLYPSLFTCWKAAYILPKIITHPHVIRVLSGGADLMLPGTVPPFDPRAVKGSIVGIVDSANPTVIKAIGRCKLNLPQFTLVIGRTGIAVEVMHHLDDELYKLNKFVDIPIPEQVVDEVPLKEHDQEPKPTEEGHSAEDKHDEQPVHDKEEQEVTQDYGTAINDPDSDDPDVDNIAEELTTLTVEEVDNFFIRSLLQTIKTDKIELPITSSTFMSNHIYKNLPVVDSSYCNIKKTSWKKTTKYLKAMEKLKYLTVKGKGDDLSVVSLTGSNNPAVQNFVVHKTMGSVKKDTNSTTTTTGNKKDKSLELNVVYLYKPTSKSRMIFNKTEEDFQTWYTQSEVRDILNKYIKIQNLVNPKDPKKINLDDNLNAMTSLGIGAHPRDKLFKTFLSNFSPYYVVLRPGESLEDDTVQLNKGEPPTIKIITQMKIGRKIITRILNFEKFFIKPHILSDDLKVKCSGSTTIGPCVENPALTEVTVQGPHGKIIMEYLNSKGIPNTFINFEDKVKKKKRR